MENSLQLSLTLPEDYDDSIIALPCGEDGAAYDSCFNYSALARNPDLSFLEAPPPQPVTSSVQFEGDICNALVGINQLPLHKQKEAYEKAVMQLAAFGQALSQADLTYEEKSRAIVRFLSSLYHSLLSSLLPLFPPSQVTALRKDDPRYGLAVAKRDAFKALFGGSSVGKVQLQQER